MLICEGIFFIAGIYLLITGRFSLGRRVVQGGRARLIGLILVIPGPLAFIVGAIIGFNAGMSGQTSLPEDTIIQVSVLELLLLVATVVVVAILTFTVPPVPPGWSPYYQSGYPWPYSGYQMPYQPPGQPPPYQQYGGYPMPYQQLPGSPLPPQAGQPQTVFTTQEAARYLRVLEQDVVQMIESGQLPAIQIGGQWRLTKEALDAYLNAQSGGTGQ